MGMPVPFFKRIAPARATAARHGPIVRAPESWLADHGVGEWSGPRSLPLWLADRSWHGMNARSNKRALAAGLELRPLSDTLAATLQWELSREDAGPHGAGLTDSDERELLAELN